MSQLIEVKVPDIGDYKDVPVIEVMVKPGDTIEKEQSIVTLESDKATMDVPSSHSGVVKEVRVKVGDTISEGAVVVLLEEAAGSTTAVAAPATQTTQSAPTVSAPPAKAPVAEPPVKLAPPPPPISNIPAPTSENMGHASPSVRKFARELGVTITQVTGSGPKGRITQEDVQAFVKAAMSGGGIPAAA
jgi:pyruvate dehydrogenase E2 component (dihydrolipoamide acetyltransferase)